MIFRNTSAVSAAMISRYVLSFVLAPIMLTQLGLAQFGVWAVTGAIVIYAGLIDLGVTRALSRFVAFYHARDDRRTVEQLLGLGLITVGAVGLIAATVSLVAAPLVADLLGDVLSGGDMRIVLLCSASIFVLNATRSVLRSVPDGMQRMVPPSIAEVIANLIAFAFSVAALIASSDLVVYALANVAAALVSVIPTVIAVRYVWSPIRARRPSRPVVGEVLGFSLKSQLAWVGDLVNNQTDKIIIAVFIDIRVAAAYELANRAVLAVKAVATLSISAMIPAATAQISREGAAVVGDFYRRYTPRALSMALPLMAFSCVAAPVLLVAWLGEAPDDSVEIFIALTLANCVNLSTGVAFSLSLGEGKAGLIAFVSLLTVAINIVATLILTPLFGLTGVIAGTVLAIVGGCAVYLVRFHRAHGIPAMDYVRAAGVPAALAALAAAPIAVWLLVAGAPSEGRAPAGLATLAFAAVYVAAYWVVASRLDILPDRLRLGFMRRPTSAAA